MTLCCTCGIFGRELPNIWSYTVHVYGSDQPYSFYAQPFKYCSPLCKEEVFLEHTFRHRHVLFCSCHNCISVALIGQILTLTQTQTLGKDQSTIKVDIPLLIDCTFCAATGMIAFGAVIGKATPTQLMWLMVALVGATHSSSMVSEFLVGVSASEAQR